MKYLTIKPLARFLATSPRDCVSMAELISLENQILKTTKTGGNSHKSLANTVSGQNYLSLLAWLRNTFDGQSSITREGLFRLTDKWLRRQNLYYIRRKHNSFSDNIFDPREFSSPGFKNLSYDLSYYNPEARGCGGHHYFQFLQKAYMEKLTVKVERVINDSGSHGTNTLAREIVNMFDSDLADKEPLRAWYNIFYIRCEEFADTVLYGNLQIDLDDKKLQLSDKEIVTKVMLRSNNLYCQMVQEALRHALELDKSRILFQAGQAAAYSQWEVGDERINMELISSENLTTHKKIYQKELAELANLRPGDIFVYGDDKKGLIVKKRAGRPVFLNAYLGLLLPAVFLAGHKFGYGAREKNIMPTLDEIKTLQPGNGTDSGEGATTIDQLTPRYYTDAYGVAGPRSMIYNAHRALYYSFVHYFVDHIEGDLEKALTALNLIFNLVTGEDYSSQTESKLKSLAALRDNYLDEGMEDNLYVFVNDFLLKFNYHSKLLSNFPEIYTLTSNDGQQLFFYDSAVKETFRTLEYPAINNFSPYASADYLRDPQEPILPQRKSPSWLYNWYEYVLPEIFKTLGLTYKKTLISKNHDDKTYTAYAWEITTPLSELRKKPMVMI